MSFEIPFESTETLAAEVTVDGVNPSGGVSLAVVPAGARPAPGDYVAATAQDGDWVVELSGLSKGWYDVWTKVDLAVTRHRNVLEVV